MLRLRLLKVVEDRVVEVVVAVRAAVAVKAPQRVHKARADKAVVVDVAAVAVEAAAVTTVSPQLHRLLLPEDPMAAWC